MAAAGWRDRAPYPAICGKFAAHSSGVKPAARTKELHYCLNLMACYSDRLSIEELIMRKAILAIAFALAVVGAGFIAGAVYDPEPAVAGCTKRC
jgi:hypothetical protein